MGRKMANGRLLFLALCVCVCVCVYACAGMCVFLKALIIPLSETEQ